MVLSMTDNGKMTEKAAREYLLMQMEMFMKVIGRKIRPTGMVNT